MYIVFGTIVTMVLTVTVKIWCVDFRSSAEMVWLCKKAERRKESKVRFPMRVEEIFRLVEED